MEKNQTEYKFKFSDNKVHEFFIIFQELQKLAYYRPLHAQNIYVSELFPNCADLQTFDDEYHLESEYSIDNSYQTIDPDGEGGVEPFTVHCTLKRTTVTTVVGKTQDVQ